MPEPTLADDLSIFALSLRIALLSTLTILPFGIGLAWAIARFRGPGKAIVETFLSLPLVLPPTAVGIVLLQLLRRDGLLGKGLAAAGIDIVFTWRAAALAAGVMSFPLLVRSARTAFEEVDPRLIGIGRTLGDSPMRVFLRVALPLAWRGIFAGTLLAFCRALGEFGATILVAGNIPGRTQTLALAIFQRTETGRDAAALRLVGWTTLVAFAAVYAAELWGRRERGRSGP
jgi:molybdate transport system permease protein